MTLPEKRILSDPAVVPDDALLSRCLGEKMEWWNTIMDHTILNYPSVTPIWKYYNDGKQWLFRLLRKKDTIFWVSLIGDTFRITLYYSDKAEPLILASNVPDAVKQTFLEGKHFGKIRGLTIRIDSPQDLETVKELTAIKLQIK
jgi:hypothetical protein